MSIISRALLAMSIVVVGSYAHIAWSAMAPVRQVAQSLAGALLGV